MTAARVMTLMCLAMVLTSCEGSRQTAPADMVDAPGVNLSEFFAEKPVSLAPVDPHPDAVPSNLNSPRSAAQELATRGGSIDKSAEREIELHAALYRAAMSADGARHPAYLLVASADDRRQAKSLTPRELRLRVLASMQDLSIFVAWDSLQHAWRLDARAPGGAAARAWFEVIREDDALATIEADVCVESVGAGTRKYRVEAVYDGLRWNVRDLGARTTW